MTMVDVHFWVRRTDCLAYSHERNDLGQLVQKVSDCLPDLSPAWSLMGLCGLQTHAVRGPIELAVKGAP